MRHLLRFVIALVLAGPGQHHGSEFVEVGLRARDGRLPR